MDNYTDLPSPRRHINYAVNGKVMLCTGVVIFFALLVVLCFHNYARLIFRNRRRRYLRRRAQHLLSVSTTAADPTKTAPKELRSKLIYRSTHLKRFRRLSFRWLKKPVRCLVAPQKIILK
ncbi:hypothetical protein CCACVL1_22213 [Corchorus capsularis]|uniref:Uncharacterized protein n=1 Tax=Corchorus capsularis TaxID=210143 RepID=A0A1R3H0K7_COCAP|nr:hypothetical protein CCACVL1_22213 [Corchorus capsularis]